MGNKERYNSMQRTLGAIFIAYVVVITFVGCMPTNTAGIISLMGTDAWKNAYTLAFIGVFIRAAVIILLICNAIKLLTNNTQKERYWGIIIYSAVSSFAIMLGVGIVANFELVELWYGNILDVCVTAVFCLIVNSVQSSFAYLKKTAENKDEENTTEE